MRKSRNSENLNPWRKSLSIAATVLVTGVINSVFMAGHGRHIIMSTLAHQTFIDEDALEPIDCSLHIDACIPPQPCLDTTPSHKRNVS